MLNQDKTVTSNEAKLGQELVVEFLEDMQNSLPPSQKESILLRMNKHIQDKYGCKAEALVITDDEADVLNRELFAIAVEDDLATARLPFTSW